MNKRQWSFLLLGLFLFAMATPLMAQDQPAVYTRVAFWNIDRQYWEGYQKNFEEYDQPVFEKLLADGVITEWGSDAEGVHTAEGATHANWFSAKSIANLERALEEVQKGMSKMSPEVRKKSETDFAGPKHYDLLFHSDFYRSRPVKLDSGYDMTNIIKVKRGKAGEYRKLWEKYTKPILDQLFNDGTIKTYALFSDYIHTSTPGNQYTWYVVADAAALDKVDAAFAAERNKRTPEEREAVMRAFEEITVEGSHRDDMSRILHYSSK